MLTAGCVAYSPRVYLHKTVIADFEAQVHLYLRPGVCLSVCVYLRRGVCVCVCVYIYVVVSVCVCVYLRRGVCLCVCIPTSWCLCVCISTSWCLCVCVYLRPGVCVCVCISTSWCVCARVCVCIDLVTVLTADGLVFSHPLHHIGKTVADLPLIVIDSFKHIYTWPHNPTNDLTCVYLCVPICLSVCPSTSIHTYSLTLLCRQPSISLSPSDKEITVRVNCPRYLTCLTELVGVSLRSQHLPH